MRKCYAGPDEWCMYLWCLGEAKCDSDTVPSAGLHALAWYQVGVKHTHTAQAVLIGRLCKLAQQRLGDVKHCDDSRQMSAAAKLLVSHRGSLASGVKLNLYTTSKQMFKSKTFETC